MDILVRETPITPDERNSEQHFQEKKRKAKSDRRKAMKDRRQSVNEGLVVSLSGREDKRSLKDRRSLRKEFGRYIEWRGDSHQFSFYDNELSKPREFNLIDSLA